MIKMNTEELLMKGLLVNEPVYNIHKLLQEKNSRKIIIDSGRGSGKTVILKTLEKDTVGYDHKYIYTHFDSISCFHANIFKEDFIRHYYELIFATKLLNYIQKYYPAIYETTFKKISMLVKEIGADTDNFIRNALYLENLKLNRYLKTNELVKAIIERFKTVCAFENLSILIDRFDWTANNDPLIQKILSEYFVLFNKAIITSDDEKLSMPDLVNNGYDLLLSTYSYNPLVIKEIVKRRIIAANRDDLEFPVELLEYVDYTNLINITYGNISLMLDIIYKAINFYNWNCDANFQKALESAIQDCLKNEEEFKKILKPKHLYL